MTNGKTLKPGPIFEAKKRRYKIWLLQRPLSGLDAILAAQGHKLNRERIISEAQELGLSLESIAPFLNGFSTTDTTTTGTNAEVEGGSKGSAADPTEPIGQY
uniref:uncharacterized protein LOC122598281 n=1 Tax=Erigeron canadensis TaxID=72917 RepID=UPI001CB9015D|nr:uncharacterized protein LOC122598281 [Erigeron canadensis]